jgi:hypothetical protein
MPRFIKASALSSLPSATSAAERISAGRARNSTCCMTSVKSPRRRASDNRVTASATSKRDRRSGDVALAWLAASAK